MLVSSQKQMIKWCETKESLLWYLLDSFNIHKDNYITLNQSEHQIKTLKELKEILVLKKYDSIKIAFKNNDQLYHFYK